MRYLFTLACLLLVTSTLADDAEFDFKSNKAKAAVQKYQDASRKTNKRNLDSLIRSLEAAFKNERTDGDLEEAIKIRDTIKALKKGASPAGASAAGRKSKTRIPRDAVKWNGHFYKAIPLKGTHQAALNYCAENGGHLARIESKDEQAFIERLLSGSNESYWIDGSDEAREGRWMFSNGTPMSYFNWHPSEPNKSFKGIEDFLMVYASRSKNVWNDADGASSYPFICEWDGPAGSTQRAKKIPADAVKYKGNYYKAYDEGMPHSVAQKRCGMMGGHLVRIETSAKQAFIETLASRGKNIQYWIDGTDEETEGTWRFDDGTPMHYFNWGSVYRQQPNNDNGVSHCLVLYRGDKWRWHDNSSGERQWGFICEWDE